MAEAGVIDWHSATPMPNYAKRTKDPEWHRKQQQREYRVAARREKRFRKADEKKQRKLNATILRRMTRNPLKYTKNAERNRVRACEGERRRIREAAMQQVRELAIVHDPSGELFNIGPVARTEDGRVRSEDSARRWEFKQAKKNSTEEENKIASDSRPKQTLPHGVDPERAAANGLEMKSREGPKQHGILSKPKPHIPEGIRLPTGEENWLELWDLNDIEIEARLRKAKKKAGAQRKALRLAQKSGKVERRAARDEKRKVYKQLKETWKVIKADEKKHKTAMKAIEDREGKVIAVKVAAYDRRRAMEICEALGCTIENTPGTNDIQPRLLGMKGRKIDFDDLEFGEGYIDIRLKSQSDIPKPVVKTNRVDLSAIAEEAQMVIPKDEDEDDVAGGGEYIQLDVGEGQEYQSLNLNHRLRKKIRRAVDRVQLQKELLVRSKVRFLLKEMGVEPPAELLTYGRPKHVRGQRVLETGLLETDKKARIRQAVELAEFNKAAKLLRKQAKALATEAGLRVYAEKTGRIPFTPRGEWDYGPGWIEPQAENPLNLIRQGDVKIAEQHAEQAAAEMDDIYSWADEDEDMELDQS